MWMDAVDLRDFYATPLGRTARRLLCRNIREFWPDVSGQRLLGVGYTTPILGAFRGEAERVLAAMPARQGVLHWPKDAPGLSVLTEESELPFPDLSMDRIILLHAVECSEELRPMLREVWRVLSESGRVLIIAPNRRSIWARMERTPFGHGNPYSPRQLTRLLRDTMFTPMRTKVGLFVPPSRSRMMLSSATAWEEIGSRLFPGFGGVVMVEASKEIYAGQPVMHARKKRSLFALPQRNMRREGKD